MRIREDGADLAGSRRGGNHFYSPHQIQNRFLSLQRGWEQEQQYGSDKYWEMALSTRDRGCVKFI